MERIKRLLERIDNNKIVRIILIGILTIIIASILTIIVISIRKYRTRVSELEKIKLIEVSDEITNYFDEISLVKENDLDKYINFALIYNYNTSQNTKMTIREVKELINSKFTKQVTEEEILKKGITAYLVEKNITYDSATNVYEINNVEKTYADIASTKIVKYEIEKIAKRKKKYEITYSKFEIENPYEILNYYVNKNADKVIIDDINAYLKGKENLKIIKKYITSKNIKNFGKKVDEVKIVYEIKDGNILAEITNNKSLIRCSFIVNVILSIFIYDYSFL